MDIIQLTRELGKEIQKDQTYIAYQLAKQNSDEDQGLQDLIGEFNLKRMSIGNEAQKQDRDEAKITDLNNALRGIYSDIMENVNMQAYNAAKGEIDALMQRVAAILTQSAEGEDPETCDLPEEGCGGDCSGCSGCN